MRDAVDAEQLEELVRSAAYAAIARRYRKMYEGKLRDLTKPVDALATAELRGFLAGIEACERVPAILKAEIAAERKKGRR
jgi:hypothetical protein